VQRGHQLTEVAMDRCEGRIEWLASCSHSVASRSMGIFKCHTVARYEDVRPHKRMLALIDCRTLQFTCTGLCASAERRTTV